MTPEEIEQSVHIKPTPQLLDGSLMKVIDIRTPGEWMQTGIVPGSHTITFFDEYGNYDAEAFLKHYEAVAAKDELVGLICRTGSRTRMVTNFLRQQGYKVVNLDGGVFHLHAIGFSLAPYQKSE